MALSRMGHYSSDLATECRLRSSRRIISPFLRPSRFFSKPLYNKSPGQKCGRFVVSLATEDPFDVTKAAQDAWKDLQEAWDKTEDKLVLGALGFSAFLVLWASIGVVSAIDKLPLIPSFFELVGFFYSTWFVYRYLLFRPDREELLKKLDGILNDIVGSDNDAE